MAFTRRGLVASGLLAAAHQAFSQQAGQGQTQQPQGQQAQQPLPTPNRHQPGPKPRATPALCLWGDQLLKINYEDVAPMIRPLGLDGVDLMAQPGGHIEPEHADLHLERAIESMTGNGVEVWCMSTSFTAPTDPTLRLALEWSGEMGVPMVRPGDWKFTDAEPEARLIEVQREISMLAQMARQTGTTIAIHNGTSDVVGGSVWDLYFILRGMDARLVGYDFDIANAAGQSAGDGWETGLRLVLPRLKKVTARDVYWSKDSGQWKLTDCPMGEGMVDWPKFLAELARHKFAGPITLHVGYSPKDEFTAIRNDVKFLKKQLATAYGG